MIQQKIINNKRSLNMRLSEAVGGCVRDSTHTDWSTLRPNLLQDGKGVLHCYHYNYGQTDQNRKDYDSTPFVVSENNLTQAWKYHT